MHPRFKSSPNNIGRSSRGRLNEIVVTNDGSHTLRSESFAELYHSHHGAITESKQVFIESGLAYSQQQKQSNITLLEYGFGTGLNAALTWEWCDRAKVHLHYISLEKYPIQPEEAELLNYGELLSFERFSELHSCPWGEEIALSEYFTLTKHATTFEDFHFDGGIDLIYYDAFAPNIQPQLWLNPHLEQVVSQLVHEGVLVTYCAKGSFKRALKSLGMTVQSLPGPPGKREITRAIK